MMTETLLSFDDGERSVRLDFVSLLKQCFGIPGNFQMYPFDGRKDFVSVETPRLTRSNFRMKKETSLRHGRSEDFPLESNTIRHFWTSYERDHGNFIMFEKISHRMKLLDQVIPQGEQTWIKATTWKTYSRKDLRHSPSERRPRIALPGLVDLTETNPIESKENLVKKKWKQLVSPLQSRGDLIAWPSIGLRGYVLGIGDKEVELKANEDPEPKMDKYRYDFEIEDLEDEMDAEAENAHFYENDEFPPEKLKEGRDAEMKSVGDFDVKDDVNPETLTQEERDAAISFRFVDKWKGDFVKSRIVTR